MKTKKISRKSKLATPDWIREGYDSKVDYEKAKGISKKKSEKTFNIKICPNCKSRDVGVVIGGQIGMWECHKCKFRTAGFPEMELNEEEFMKFLDEEEKNA